jgi:phosphonate metabolism protein PhnN/1,5-bisphosphokinase (PRPP-forming)
MNRGTLFLMVGPSGAGKDSLIQAAAETLAGNRSYVIARRAITRPADSAREDHEPLSIDEFRRRLERDDFMLSWTVYDTHYGIPRSYDELLATGTHVIANVSRTVVGPAVTDFAPARVIQVTAPREVLEARLRARADPATVAARLARAVMLPEGIPVTHLLNVGDLSAGAARLVHLLTAAAAA